MKKGKTKTSWLPPFISLKVKSKSNSTTNKKRKKYGLQTFKTAL